MQHTALRRKTLLPPTRWVLLTGLLLVTPADARSQTMDQVFRFMQEGGAWLSLDIVEGRGSFKGHRVPTMGMNLAGWFQVADTNRGEWSIRVVDLAGDPAKPVIEVDVESGQRVPFAYDAGATVEVRIDVEWSEPADTVLWIWLGTQAGEPGAGGRH